MISTVLLTEGSPSGIDGKDSSGRIQHTHALWKSVDDSTRDVSQLCLY